MKNIYKISSIIYIILGMILFNVIFEFDNLITLRTLQTIIIIHLIMFIILLVSSIISKPIVLKLLNKYNSIKATVTPIGIKSTKVNKFRFQFTYQIVTLSLILFFFFGFLSIFQIKTFIDAILLFVLVIIFLSCVICPYIQFNFILIFNIIKKKILYIKKRA